MEETVARRMLNLLINDGWTKGRTHSLRGEHCLVGAWCRMDRINDRRPALRAFDAVIREQFPDRRLSPASRRAIEASTSGDGIEMANFNDNPATTFADIELVLEKVDMRLQESEVELD